MSRLLVLIAVATPLSSYAADRPRVASINLCTDQLVLAIADPEQIATVSWLAADPEESMLADAARRHDLNYGAAEEILHHDPDVVLGGTYTNAFTRRLLERLGYRVVTIDPADDVAGIARNVRAVAAAIDRTDRGEEIVARMLERAAVIRGHRPADSVPAVVVRPGGFTVGAGTLADELMRLAGLGNVVADAGLDRWGSLSLEALITSRPQLLILVDYRRDEASLANRIFEHPAMSRVRDRIDTAVVDGRYWACGLPESLRSAERIARSIRKGPRP